MRAMSQSSCSYFFTSTVAVFRFVVSILWSFAIIYSESKEFCQNDNFIAKCPGPDKVILITYAKYGRMKMGDCVRTDFGYIGCSSDVIDHVHGRCSGRKSCIIRVPDPFLDQTNPCNEELINYFEANYECITTALPDTKSSSCELSSKTEKMIGFISNLELPQSYKRCGSSATPWTITVFHGQRINVTLLDFSSAVYYDDDDAVSMSDVIDAVTLTPTVTSAVCDRYAIFQEGAEQRFLCGSKSVSESLAYTSSSNSVKVILLHRRDDDDYSFLLKYEAIGCSDVLETPSNVWFKRVRDFMEIGCHMSDIKWRLTCVGNRWEGMAANCSLTSLKDARREDGHQMLSIGASILIILSVSLGIGLVVLLFGLYYMKRKHERNVLGQGIQMRDMKSLPSGSAGYEGHEELGGGGGGGSVYSRNTAFEPVRLMNVTRVEKSTGRSGKGCISTTTCNIEDGSDYEYVWNMSPPLLSSSRPPKMRLKQQQQLEPPSGARPISDQNRPDLVSKLESADDSPERRGSSTGLPVTTRCTCGLDEARKAATGPGDSRPPSAAPADDDGILEAAATESSPRVRARFRKTSGGEERALIDHPSSSSPSYPSPSLPSRRTRDTRPTDAAMSPGSVTDSISDGGSALSPSVSSVGVGSRPAAAAPGGDSAPTEGPIIAGGSVGVGGLKKVCRHCGHVVVEGGGSGSVRFAPGVGTSATMQQQMTSFGSLAKRLTVKDDGNTIKHGVQAGNATIQPLHKR